MDTHSHHDHDHTGFSSSGTRSRSNTRSALTNLTVRNETGAANAETIKGGTLGRGYNILDGTNKTQLFDKLAADYFKGQGRTADGVEYFEDYNEYEHELAKRVGMKYSEGMFSLYCAEEHEAPPILCKIEKIENWHHLVFELEEEDYQLKLKQVPELSQNVLNDKDVKFVMENRFTQETKHRFYSVFHKFGTHWVKQVRFGSKAELRWSFQEKLERDTVDQLSKTHKTKQFFKSAIEDWKKTEFGKKMSESKKGVPKNVEEHSRLTDNFHLPENERRMNPRQVGFKLQEISVLFPADVSGEVELAVKAYLAEMKPKRDINKLKENCVVAIYCIDTHHFLGVDDHGHLKPTESHSIKLEHKFEVKKKGNRIGLKSILYGNRYLSRAMTKSFFHFHRLQFMGPHESFEISGDFIYSCGSLHAPTMLYIGDDGQIHHDGKKKNRFCLLDVECRIPPGLGEMKEEDIKEPLWFEDTELEVTVQSSHIAHPDSVGPVGLLKKEALLHKSNSTSSLFIKDTITLPNVDELTRRMALQLYSMIQEGHKVPHPVVVEVFSELKHPLTKQVSGLDKPPSVETIFHFLNTIFKVEKLNPEPGIMSLIYLNRIMAKTKMTLTGASWRRAVLSTLILSSKVWEDLAVWNVDFVELFPNITVKDLNKMERVVLESIDFNVSIKASEYVKQFFGLAEHAEVGKGRDTFDRPMDSEALKNLEVRTASSEKQYQKLNLHKSSSLANITRGKKKDKAQLSIGILS